MLEVRKREIVNETGAPVRLRGVCVGGWMNMENFINGYPGDEHGLREKASEILGGARAQFLFDRWLDYFFSEEDIRFLAQSGANVVRLPLNYRHFEHDAVPFRYREEGFSRLDGILSACERNGLYAILDLHACQGWQNPDWHCDNANRISLIWRHPHFQERFLALWREIARRYRGNAVVAGYNLMNEPVSGTPEGRFPFRYRTDWEAVNALYRRAVAAVREVDPEHIIFLEGDFYSQLFERLEPPSAANLVYSSHNYNDAGFGPGGYPGKILGRKWDRRMQARVFADNEGTRYCAEYEAPLWVGEFGLNFSGPKKEWRDRIRAIDDQIAVYEEGGASWTVWTYKDVGVMGVVSPDPQSDYMRLIRPILRAKRALSLESWNYSAKLPQPEVRRDLDRVGDKIRKTAADREIDAVDNHVFLAQHALSGYAARVLQPKFIRLFRGMTEAQIDHVLESFALKNCRPQKDLLAVLAGHWRAGPAAS